MFNLRPRVLAATAGLIALGAAVVLAKPVIAQGNESSILFVAPNRVTVAPNEEIAVVNVSNRSGEARRYDLAVVDQTMNSEGMTRRVDDFPYSAKRMLRFQPKRFTLQAGERQVIRIMARRPAELAAGDYHSHILFREVPLAIQDKKTLENTGADATGDNKVQFEIRTLYGVAIPVVVQHGEIVSDIELLDASFVPAADGMPAHIAVDLKRTGNAEASGIVRVRFERAGQEPVLLNGDQWVPIYREVDTVTRRVPLTKMPADQSLKGGKIVIELFKGVSKLEGVDPATLNVVRKEINL